MYFCEVLSFCLFSNCSSEFWFWFQLLFLMPHIFCMLEKWNSNEPKALCIFVLKQLQYELTKCSYSLFQSVEHCDIAWTEPCSVFMATEIALSTAGRTDVPSVHCINAGCGSVTSTGQWPRWQPSQLTLPTCWRTAWVCTIAENTTGFAGHERNIPKHSIT